MFICGESVYNPVTDTKLMSLSEEFGSLETADLDEADIPDTDDVGPAILGKEPLVGSVRREQGGLVIRDELREKLDL